MRVNEEVKKLSIVIPTLNEEDNIENILMNTINQLSDLDYEVIIVDNSEDKTPEIVRSLNDDRIFLFHKKTGKGIGSAYKFGFSKANGNVIVSMDADGSHDPRYLTGLFEGIGEFDLILGSRYLAGGSRKDPLSRRILPKLASLVYRILFKLSVSDITSGYRAYKKKVLNMIDLTSLPDDFSFQVEILLKLWKSNAKIKEIPIEFHKRTGGESKYGMKDILGNIKVFFRAMRGI